MTALLPLLSFVHVAMIGLPLLAFVQLNTLLPPWGSRKVLHIGTGMIAMCMDVDDWMNRAAVALVVATAWTTVPTGKTFHFAAVADAGILSYLTVCGVVVLLRVPFWQMAPFFLADPAGAIVGRNVSSPRLVGKKTVAGSVAVAVVAAATTFGASALERALCGVAIAAIELTYAKFDNAMIGSFLLVRAVGWGGGE